MWRMTLTNFYCFYWGPFIMSWWWVLLTGRLGVDTILILYLVQRFTYFCLSAGETRRPQLRTGSNKWCGRQSRAGMGKLWAVTSVCNIRCPGCETGHVQEGLLPVWNYESRPPHGSDFAVARQAELYFESECYCRCVEVRLQCCSRDPFVFLTGMFSVVLRGGIIAVRTVHTA